MAEHVHLTQTKRAAAGLVEIQTVVRRKYAEVEEALVRAMGYETEVRYCGDVACLGDEPFSRLDVSDLRA